VRDIEKNIVIPSKTSKFTDFVGLCKTTLNNTSKVTEVVLYLVTAQISDSLFIFLVTHFSDRQG
jgi:hypothetical protein